MTNSVAEINSTTMVEIRNLRKSYGTQVAVDGIDLEIRRGEALGLLGPNGAGKSTTINLIIGLLQPDSGSATFLDGDSSSSIEAKKQIGIAPQDLSLYEELTTSENLTFFAKLYGLAGKSLRDRVGWALEFAELEDRKNRRVKTLSGGMKRRLNLACALLHEPQLVLLDEPTVGVDPQSRNHLMESIESLKRDGLTILYTTHYMEEAQRLCDRVAIIDHGKILAVDQVDQLIASHGDASVISAELKCSLPEGVSIPGHLEGLNYRWESKRPVEEISRLVGQGAEFSTLKISQPDLESVFLSLTGRSLRDQ